MNYTYNSVFDVANMYIFIDLLYLSVNFFFASMCILLFQVDSQECFASAKLFFNYLLIRVVRFSLRQCDMWM